VGKRLTTELVTAFQYGTVLRSCTLENGSFTAPGGYANGVVIEDCDISYGQRNCAFCSGNDIVLRRSTFKGAGTTHIFDHQVYLSNAARVLVEDCLFDGDHNDNANEGLKLNGLNGVVVRRCEARYNNAGIGCYRNSGESGDPDNYLVEDCVLHDNGGTSQRNGVNIGWMTNLTIRNCVFYNNGSSAQMTGGAIEFFWTPVAANHIKVYNNTFYANATCDVWVNEALTLDGKVGKPFNITMRNNVVKRTTSSGSFIWVADPNFSLAAIDSDYNEFHWTDRGTADFTFELGHDTGASTKSNTSLDTWKGAKGKDVNSKYGDPLFSDPGHFDFTLLEGSPAIDAGLALPDIWRDKQWVARPRGPSHDCGVFEK
jgi:hypothetical protein